MEDMKNSSDLEEDAELEALRLAALATLKNRSNKVIEPDVSTVSQIQPINSITRSGDNSSDQGSRKSQPSWRNNAPLLRKRGKHFPKPNQRSSNLIVITPVGADKEKPQQENKNALQLLLPQHRWCQQANEDSSSPRTERHTGPSRFNRRGSGSESSDSDYDESDDSYSNDTVLQDEHSLLSLAETNDYEEKLQNGSNSEQATNFVNSELTPNLSNSERQLSFQDFESEPAIEDDKSEAPSVYNILKTTYSPVEIKTSQNSTDTYLHQEPSLPDSSDCNHNLKGDVQSSHLTSLKDDKPMYGLADSNLVHKNGEPPKSFQPKSKHTPITFDVVKEKSKRSVVKEKTVERLRETSHVFKDLRNHIDNDNKSSENSKHKTASLSRNDLRYELKRKKEVSGHLVSPKKYKTNAEHNPNGNKGRSWSRERSVSKDRKISKRSRSRSYSPKRRRRRHSRNRHSSSQSNRSSSSSSSSSNTSRSSSPIRNRSVSSVVQPVQSKIVVTDTQNSLKSSVNRKPNLSSSGTELFSVKKAKGIEIKLNPRPNFKISVLGKDSLNNSLEVKKRGPVHMRLGTLPRKRIIQMPKAVEAAFVSTSSDDDTDVNNKCKKSNITVVTDLSVSRYSENELTQRSDVPKDDRGKFFR
ncbi:pre-mRNA-splicing factor CWC22 homolog [Parasteatoda tepidariorum]|uniref:pre-mRNA-splicing factor CWC22 homolog n=1 Tax=Parasteatoda tepidariorum TaxID=114398 RepID=UPI001C71E47A|nr:pre-mRNA-splicing factor CWC22 homolog [Parasteatoda tepidariorum]